MKKTKKSLGLPRGTRRAKWGQNFLRDKNILRKIADCAQIGKGDTVVEIGPGEGTLTELLLEKAARVIAIEKDQFLVKRLAEKFCKQIKNGKLEIACMDILNYELRINNYALVGNIPYYITGAIFKKFLQSNSPPKSLTFVMQKEVAERIMARDGKESVLSISIKVYGDPDYEGVIKSGNFSPRPKVDSAIISIHNISKKRFTKISPPNPFPLGEGVGREVELNCQNPEQKFFAVLKKGFAHKRKLLLKNLGVSKTAFDICKIPEKARAEDLTVDNWVCLSKKLL